MLQSPMLAIVLLSLCGVIIGLAGVVRFARPMRLCFASRRWPHTNGTMVSSDVMGVWTSHLRTTRTREPAASLLYEYEVDGTRYYGSVVRFDESGAALGLLDDRAVAARYPLNARVTVLYDPEQPGCCALERGQPLWPTVLVCVSAAILLAGLGGLIVAATRAS